ncbi:MAG: flagellar filament capping protein FliD [Burkholderiaceae bacterium]
MATVSSSTSSGTIDVTSIVDSLMQVEQKPLDSLQTKASAINADITAFGSIKSLLTTFQDASRALTNSTTWNASKATSGDPTTVDVVGTNGAIKGNLSITVQQLAQAQSATTGTFASASAVVGGGTLSVQIGSGAPVDITIAAGATIAQVRDAINNAGAGINASLVADGGQVRLLVRSSETGVANAFSISVGGAEDGSASGLGALGAMTQTQAAQDAQYTLDGLALTSASNKITDAVEGVTLTLKKTSDTPVAVALESDTTTLRSNVDAFVSAYNALVSKLADLTKYDATSKTAGELQGNSTAVRLLQQLRQMISSTVSESSVGTLSAAGIAVQRDGTLKIDDTKFNVAAADPTQFKALFAAPLAADGSGGGIASRFNSMITRTLGTDGLLTAALDTLNKRLSANGDQQDAIERRLEQTRTRLTRLYSTLDANLSSLQSLSDSLTTSLAALAANTNNNN